jgi:PEP-CTERM motif
MRVIVRAGLCALVLLGGAAPARADIMFFFSDPGALQPAENLLFNEPGLLNDGLMVQGVTNNTATLIDISGQESLIADGGQARVLTTDNGFQWLMIAADDPGLLFSEFEANLVVYSPPGPPPSGTVTVTVTNNFGAIEQDSYIVSGGQNYFSLLAIDPQLIRSILIESDLDLADIRQIRLGGVVGDTPPTVPEPAMMALFGFALLAGGRRLRRR